MDKVTICGRMTCDMQTLAAYSVVSFTPFDGGKEVSYSSAYDALLKVRKSGVCLFPNIQTFGGGTKTDVFVADEDIPYLSQAGRCRRMSCRAFAERAGEGALIRMAVGYAVVRMYCRPEELPGGVLRIVRGKGWDRYAYMSSLRFNVKQVSVGDEPFPVACVETLGLNYKKDPKGTARVNYEGFVVRGGTGLPCSHVTVKNRADSQKRVRVPVEVYSDRYAIAKDYFLEEIMKAVHDANIGISIEPLEMNRSDALTYAAFSDREPLLSEQKAFRGILTEYGLQVKGDKLGLVGHDDLVRVLGVPYILAPDKNFATVTVDDPRAVCAGPKTGPYATNKPVHVYLPINEDKAELCVVYHDRLGCAYHRTVTISRNKNKDAGPALTPSDVLSPDGKLVLSIVPVKDKDTDDIYGHDIAPNVQHVTDDALNQDEDMTVNVLRAAIRELCVSTVIMDDRLDFVPPASFFSAFYMISKEDTIRAFRMDTDKKVCVLTDEEKCALYDRVAELSDESYEMLMEDRAGNLYSLTETGMQAVPYIGRDLASFATRKKEYAATTGGLYDFSWMVDGDRFVYVSGHTRQANARRINAYPHLYMIRALSGEAIPFRPEDVFELLNVGFVRQDRNSTAIPYPFKFLRRAAEIEAAKQKREKKKENK